MVKNNFTVARNYKKIREFRAKTQDQVVKGTGISKQNVSIWENERGNPGQEFIDQLAVFLTIPKEVFYMDSLTDEYLKKNFSDVNTTPVQETTDNKENRGEVYRKIIEGETEYVMIPRSVFEEKYRLVALEKIAEDSKELDRKNKQIDDLTDIIKSMALSAKAAKVQKA